MICVTGGEREVGALARRLEAHRDAELQEVRLDLLEAVDDEVLSLLGSTPRLLITCRGEAEGGGFSGSEGEHAELLRRALALGPAYLDVEASAPEALRRELFQRRGDTRLICSMHRFEPGGVDAADAARLARQPADLLKLAVAVQDAAELGEVLGVLPDEPREVLRIAMGDAGLLSRALYRRFGSPWTYLLADGAPAVAPGQLSVGEASDLRLQQVGLEPLGLVGGPQVMGSPGPPVYNRIFSRRGLPWRYLPVVTRRPLEALPVLQRLGFVGLTVTMPAKLELLPAARGWLRPGDAHAGACNTLVRREGGWLAANTDVDALAQLLEPWRAGPVLVLGAGGAARAAVAACARLGCTCEVSARDAVRGEALGATFVPWARRGRRPFAALVNATPVGSDGLGDPLPADISLAGKGVVDAALRPGGTPLLRRAASDGASTFDGADWWVRQGAAQIPLLTGEALELGEIREALEQTWRRA